MTVGEPNGASINNIGILWDLDGVLVDSGAAHYQAWSKTCARYSIPFSPEAFQRTFGMNNAGIVTTLIGHVIASERVSEISLYKEELFRQTIHGHAQIFPGVRLWLDRFQGAKLPQAVASSAPSANIDVTVDELGVRSYFTAVVSGAEMRGKPDPAVFLEAARRIGLPPENCLVIEDSVAGVQAALRGGMKCLAVTTTNPRALLKDAHLILDSLELLSWKAVSCIFHNP